MTAKTGIIVGVFAAAAVAAAAFAGAGGVKIPAFGPQSPASAQIAKAAFSPNFQGPPGAPVSFADIFEKVSPAVVQIEVTVRAPQGASIEDLLQGLPPEALPFGIPGAPQDRGGRGGGRRPQPREAHASGSGFFISSDGYVVTNNHVVEEATKIEVVNVKGERMPATVVGLDKATDLAVLKVEGRGFPYVSFENSSKPRVGDWVITIGNPFGLGTTATAGIVSAQRRDIDDAWVDFLQVDAPINRGNSGGPTFDVYGRVIGVNSTILSPNPEGGSVGIGFAIPADIAENVAKQLIRGGAVSRGYLGADIATVSEDMAETYGLSRDRKGVLINSVRPKGPAETAGLQSEDIVLSINGAAVKTSTELMRQVGATPSGETVRLQILRDGRERTIPVRLARRPTDEELAAAPGDDERASPPRGRPAPPRVEPDAMGMVTGELDDVARSRFNIPVEVTGVVVIRVAPGSPASGLIFGPNDAFGAGDVIAAVNGKAVTSPSEVRAAMDEAAKAKKPVRLRILHRGRTMVVVLKLEDEE